MSYAIFREFDREHLEVVCAAFENDKAFDYCPIGLLLARFGSSAGHVPCSWVAATVIAGTYSAPSDALVARLAPHAFAFMTAWDRGVVTPETLRAAMGLPAR